MPIKKMHGIRTESSIHNKIATVLFKVLEFSSSWERNRRSSDCKK